MKSSDASSVAIPIPSSRSAGARLLARVGCASAGAPGKSNDDFYGVVGPRSAAEAGKGLVVAVADGVSGGGGGRLASEVTVGCVTADYFTTPDAWPQGIALDRVLQAANSWLAGEGMRRPDLQGAVAAVSVLILRDQEYYLAHVGDTRVYLLRDGHLRQLTADHSWPRRDMRHVLRRAVGLDNHLVVDCAQGPLRDGDKFLLVTDGVWDVLGEAALLGALADPGGEQAAAIGLVQAARERQAAYHGRNDATALVVSLASA